MHLRRFTTEKINGLPPTAMVITGLILVAGSLVWPRFTALHGSMSASNVDVIQGFLMGMGIACEVMGVGSMLPGRKGNEDGSVVPRE